MAAAMALSGTAATGGEAAVSYRQRNLKAGPQQAQTQELALTAYSHIVRSLGPSHEELLLKTYEAMDEAFSEEAEFSMFADWAPGVARPDRPISLVRAEAFADSEHKPDETPAAAVLSSRSKKFWSSAEAPTTSRLGVRLPKVQMVSAIEIVFNDTSTPPSTVPAKVQLELSEDGAAYEPVGEQVKVARPSDDSADGAAAADDGSPAEDLEAAMAAADARGSGAGGDGGEVVSVRLPVGKPIRFFRFSLTGQLEPKSTTGGSGGKPTHQVKHVSVLVPDEDAADVPAEQVIRDHCAALAVAAAPGGLSLPAKQRALNAAVYLFRATASLHVGVTLLRLLASVLSDVREAARATVPGGGEEAEAAADEAVAAPSVATALLDDMAVPALVSSQHMASEGTPGDIVQLLASAGAGGGAGSGPSLKPEFDPVHKGPGATFSNGNKTWTATRGSNNWGVAVEGISSGQASWEFEIISDMDDDEQGCCGFATRKPVIQGGYSNGGSDINCIRHYNGGLYTAGSQNRSIDAIHPGCVVRFDANMDKGEVTVFIDGSKQSGAPHFTGLKGKTIWPAVTAYGSSVSIKFKSYKKAGAKGDGDQASYHQLIHGSLPLAVGDVRSQKFVGRLGALSGQGYTKTKIKVAGARLPHAYSMWPGAGSTANARPVGGKATAASGGAASESKTGEQGGEADPAMALVGADVGLDDAYARWDMAQVIESAEKQVKEAKKKAKKGGDKDDKKKGGDKKGKKGPDKPVVDAVPSNVGVLYLQFALDDSTQKTAIPVAVDVLVDGRLAARTAPMAPTAGTMAENDFIKACVEPNDFRPATVVPSKVPQVYRVAVSRSSTVELRAKTVPGARCQSKQALAAALGKRQAARVVVACLEADTKLEGQDDFVGMRTVSQPEGTVLPPVMDHSQVGMGIGQALSQAAQVLLELCTAHNVATRQAVLVTGDDLGDDADDDKKGKEEEEKEAEEEKGDGDDKSKGLSKAASKAKRAADALKRLRKKLEEPMAVEVRGDTLQSIGEVLKDVRGLAEIEARRFASKHGLPAVAAAKPYEVGPASQCAAGLMRAAECNLRRLVASRIDPRAVGILLPGDKGAPARGTLGGLHAALDSYVKNESGEPADVLPELRYAAANAVDAGLEVLYPTPAERRKLVAGVLGDGATLELQFAFPTVKKPPMALPGMEGLGEDGEDEDEDDLDGIASAEAGELEGCPKSRIRAIRDISKRDVRFDRAMMLAQLAAEQRGFRTELVGKWGQYLHLLVELPAPKDGAAAAAAGASESKESAGTGSDAVQFVSEELGVVFERAGMGAWQIPKGCTEPRIPMEIKRFAVFDGADRNFEQAGLGFVRLFPASACSFDRALAGVSRFVGGDGSDQADAGAGSGPASGAGM